MATITDKNIIKEMLANDGIYDTDPAPALIYRYEHVNNQSSTGEIFAVFYDARHDDMDQSPFVQNARCLFMHGVLTMAGQQWLERNTK